MSTRKNLMMAVATAAILAAGTALADEVTSQSNATTENDKPSPTLSDTQNVSGEKTDSTIGDGSSISASESDAPAADAASDPSKPSPTLSETQQTGGEKTDTTSVADTDDEYRSFESDFATFEGEIAGGYRAEDLIGKEVLDAQGNTIGEVSDLLIGADDQVQRVLVDVGGFLGMGEQNVALDIDQLQPGEDDNLVISLTEDELQTMPRYQHSDNMWRVHSE